MKDWIARVIRTFIVGAVGIFFLSYSTTVFNLIKAFAAIGPGDNLPKAPDLNFFRNMLFAMAAGGFIACLSFVWNGVEAWLGKGFLKPASPPASPTVETVAKV